jgi:predicted nuclease with TOPRIM domain
MTTRPDGKPNRATIERDIQRLELENKHLKEELAQERRAKEVYRIDLTRQREEHSKLNDEHRALVKRAAELAKKYAGLHVAHEELRSEYIVDQEESCAARKKLSSLEVIELAGRALLPFLPVDAEKRAKFSPFAKAAVAFKKALEETEE